MKILSRIIILSLIMLLVGACGDNTQDINSGEQPEQGGGGSDISAADDVQDEQVQKPELNLPDVRYDGYDFRVLNIRQSDMTWVFTTIVAEEETGEEVNDAVYRRNRLVEDRLDINIIEFAESGIGSRLSRSVQAGSDDYDLAMVELHDAGTVTLAQRGILYDYNELPYVDLTQAWWDRDMVRDLSYAGYNYLITGDFSMTHYGDTIGMFFNKKLQRDLGLESPHDIIHAGKWTFDKFSEMARGASRDLNGDGIFDQHDQYGYMSLTHIWAQGFMSSAGQQPIIKDDNDMHIFVMNNERYIETFQKMLDIMHQDNMTFDADTAGDHRLQDIMFPNNQALFWSEVVHWATILRDMDADFGIIIHPKFDESQTSYRNHVFPPPVMCVPASIPDAERTSIILEALCYESTDTVIKAYYEVLLKTKISRDDESEAMLDIMFRNRSYSLATIYYNNEITGPFHTLSKNRNADIISFIDRQEGRVLTAIDKNNEAFLD